MRSEDRPMDEGFRENAREI